MSVNSTIQILCLSAAMLAAHVTAAPRKTATIGLIGDSTVATMYGWGPSFAKQVREEVTVLNYAKNGATLDSLSKELDKLLEEKPDYVLIQFGHNDMKRYDARDYGKKLKGYVERITQGGSKAIILSSVTRRNFDAKGKIEPVVMKGRTLPEFSLSAKAIAEETNSPFVDLNSISIEHHNRIGPEVSATYNFEPEDRTHFSVKGADEIARLICKELKKVTPEFVEYLK